MTELIVTSGCIGLDKPNTQFSNIAKTYRSSKKHESSSRETRSCVETACHKYNLMWDPRIRRGSYVMDLGQNYSDYPYFEMVKKDPVCKLYLKRINCADSKASGPRTSINMQKPEISVRQSLPMELRKDLVQTPVQTDLYQEPLPMDDTFMDRPMQTESLHIFDARDCTRKKRKEDKTGVDKDAQIDFGELWDFNETVYPVVKNLPAAVLEYAMNELMQEEELGALRNQQLYFFKVKNSAIRRLKELQRLKNKMVREAQRELAAKAELSDEELPSIAPFYGCSSLQQAEINRRALFLESRLDLGSWVDREVKRYLSKHEMVSRAIVDDLIKGMVNC